MELTDLEWAALKVRHDAASQLMKRGDLTGPEALAAIVCPSPDMLAASLEVAKEKVVRTRDVSPRKLSRIRTLDDILAAA